MKYLKIIITMLLFTYGTAYAQNTGAVLKNCPKPNYPSNARIQGLEGVTTVEFVIAEEGVVSSVKVAKSSGAKELDEASLEAVRKCIFSPKLNDGVPTKQTSTMNYKWKLEDDETYKPRGGIYKVSEKNTQLIKENNLAKLSIGKVENTNNVNPTCRLSSKSLTTVPVEKYIEFAFNEELRSANNYEYGKNVIEGKILKLDYSTFLTGFWDVTIELSSENGSKISKSTKVEFSTPYGMASSCRNAEDAFLTLVQKLIGEIVSDSEFQKLIAKN